MNLKVVHLLAVLTSWIVAQSHAIAAEIWTGPTITFNNLSPTDIDQISPSVGITRGFTAGLYNASVETHFTSLSPVGTEWAYGSLGNYANLTYNTWEGWFGGPGPPGPPSTVNKDAVLHIVSEDIYLQIKFTFWGVHGGGFTYQRSTPATVPEPSSFALASLAVTALICRFRRR